MTGEGHQVVGHGIISRVDDLVVHGKHEGMVEEAFEEFLESGGVLAVHVSGLART
jgi:hypothetical protein